MKTKPDDRILTIDIMRGLTLLLMLFVNDLYVKGVPAWLTHKAADYDGMGLADWVFPGFLFMVGMAIPFAIQNRLKKGMKQKKISLHIIIRTLSLLFIGVLMLNSSTIVYEITGINKNLWAILMYFSVFLVWNNYQMEKKWLPLILKGLGIAGLIILLLVFRGGIVENPTWLKTGWWGILGLIGWGYFSASLVYLICRDNIWTSIVFWLLFLTLNILSQLELLDFLNFIKPFFGIIIQGNVPFLVATGLIISLVLRKLSTSNNKKFIFVGLSAGIFLLIAGFVLRHWFIISKIKATPSWGFICSGISVLLFVILYFVIDILQIKKWAVVFKPAGTNSLTTYLAPNVLYYIIWMTGFPLFFYKQSGNMVLAVMGSMSWAFAMVGFASLLSKIGIRLKL